MQPHVSGQPAGMRASVATAGLNAVTERDRRAWCGGGTSRDVELIATAAPDGAQAIFYQRVTQVKVTAAFPT